MLYLLITANDGHIFTQPPWVPTGQDWGWLMEKTRGWLGEDQARCWMRGLLCLTQPGEPTVTPPTQVLGWIYKGLNSEEEKRDFQGSREPCGLCLKCPPPMWVQQLTNQWAFPRFPLGGSRKEVRIALLTQMSAGHRAVSCSPAAIAFLEAMALVPHFNIVETLPRLLKMKQKCFPGRISLSKILISIAFRGRFSNSKSSDF